MSAPRLFTLSALTYPAPMDRYTAFKLLGLYVGASPQHIELKYQSAAEVLQSQLESEPARRPEFEAQLRQLSHARDVALGRGENSSLPQQSAVTAAPHTPVWRRAPVVLLMRSEEHTS